MRIPFEGSLEVVSMKRTVESTVRGHRTVDGAGVSLVRVLGGETVKDFDPLLMLDSFDSTDPEEYRAGFPLHPHRGIETISYVVKGAMRHRDSLGNEATVGDGEVQWMCAGSGILHEETIPAAGRLLGVQLWLNLPAEEKMCEPTYHSIERGSIPEVAIDGGYVRVLAGRFGDTEGYRAHHVPLTYYDIALEAGERFELDTDSNQGAMVFTLLGDAVIAGRPISEKTAVRLSAGDSVDLEAGENPVRLLYMSAPVLNEPVAWGGPIVMNTREELEHAFDELDKGTFLKSKIAVE